MRWRLLFVVAALAFEAEAQSAYAPSPAVKTFNDVCLNFDGDVAKLQDRFEGAAKKLGAAAEARTGETRTLTAPAGFSLYVTPSVPWKCEVAAPSGSANLWSDFLDQFRPPSLAQEYRRAGKATLLGVGSVNAIVVTPTNLAGLQRLAAVVGPAAPELAQVPVDPQAQKFFAEIVPDVDALCLARTRSTFEDRVAGFDADSKYKRLPERALNALRGTKGEGSSVKFLRDAGWYRQEGPNFASIYMVEWQAGEKIYPQTNFAFKDLPPAFVEAELTPRYGVATPMSLGAVTLRMFAQKQVTLNVSNSPSIVC